MRLKLKKKKILGIFGIFLIIIVILLLGINYINKGNTKTGQKLPDALKKHMLCPEVYLPVICDNGKIYSNWCFARVAGAKNCRPYKPTLNKTYENKSNPISNITIQNK